MAEKAKKEKANKGKKKKKDVDVSSESESSSEGDFDEKLDRDDPSKFVPFHSLTKRFKDHVCVITGAGMFVSFCVAVLNKLFLFQRPRYWSSMCLAISSRDGSCLCFGQQAMEGYSG